MEKIIVLAVAVTLFVAMVSSGACEVDERRARAALEASGFEHIELGRYSWFGCGGEDTFRTTFSAVNARGMSVRGALCCGWLKNCTVRLGD
jgi:hypothetical protein